MHFITSLAIEFSSLLSTVTIAKVFKLESSCFAFLMTLQMNFGRFEGYEVKLRDFKLKVPQINVETAK